MSHNSVVIRKGTTYVFPESACMTALDGSGAIILVEQFRRTIAQNTLEIPGGVLEKDEIPLETALREFTEETGLTTGKCRLLFTLDLDLSTTVHKTHVFSSLAIEPTPAREAGFKVRRVPLSQALDMVRSGTITHAPTVAAILSICANF